jgi:translation elongation factor EF-G
MYRCEQLLSLTGTLNQKAGRVLLRNICMDERESQQQRKLKLDLKDGSSKSSEANVPVMTDFVRQKIE